ncbi:YMGG-like glycine zipper-containing protein [Flavobacterium sp. GB2R13]|uniref:YMGG-like glycine zipper-containing protein n=1 Tax=Flavobacterium algoris TaxID=3398733 RepID=UPI003A891BA9
MKYIYLIALSLVIFSCQNQGKMEIQKAKLAIVDSMKQVTADSMTAEFEKQKVIDSMQIEMAKVEEAKIVTQKEVVVVNHQAAASTTTTTTKKKGWSGAAKGAVIGAGVGAVTGAIISKKKGQGAIIGGLAGAGVGAGTGAIIDGSKK